MKTKTKIEFSYVVEKPCLICQETELLPKLPKIVWGRYPFSHISCHKKLLKK